MKRIKSAAKKKLLKFLEREKRAIRLVVSRQAISNINYMQALIKNETSHHIKNIKAAKNITIQMGYSPTDFIRATETVMITYSYPKYSK